MVENVAAKHGLLLLHSEAGFLLITINDQDSPSSETFSGEKMSMLLDCTAAYDFYSQPNREAPSKNSADRLDTVKGAELSRCYIKTKQLLGKNRAFLEALIEEILEKRTITFKDIAPIREKHIVA